MKISCPFTQFLGVGFDLIMVKTILISWHSWLNIKNPFKNPEFQKWFSIWSITYWFYSAWQRWTCRIDWSINQSWSIQSKILLQSEWLLEWDQSTFHDKTFRCGNCAFSLFPLSMKLIGCQEHLDSDFLSVKGLANGPPTCRSFSAWCVPGWVFVVVQAAFLSILV